MSATDITGVDPGVVQRVLNPRPSDHVIRQVYSQIVLALLTFIIGIVILALKLYRAWKSTRFENKSTVDADIWLFRILHKPKGPYLMSNSILIWILLSVNRTSLL